MVNVELTEMNPSLSATGEPDRIALLPPADGDHEIDGIGTPLAVQVKVAMPLSFPVTVMPTSGVVMRMASEGRGGLDQWQRIWGA